MHLYFCFGTLGPFSNMRIASENKLRWGLQLYNYTTVQLYNYITMQLYSRYLFGGIRIKTINQMLAGKLVSLICRSHPETIDSSVWYWASAFISSLNWGRYQISRTKLIFPFGNLLPLDLNWFFLSVTCFSFRIYWTHCHNARNTKLKLGFVIINIREKLFESRRFRSLILGSCKQCWNSNFTQLANFGFKSLSLNILEFLKSLKTCCICPKKNTRDKIMVSAIKITDVQPKWNVSVHKWQILWRWCIFASVEQNLVTLLIPFYTKSCKTFSFL